MKLNVVESFSNLLAKELCFTSGEVDKRSDICYDSYVLLPRCLWIINYALYAGHSTYFLLLHSLLVVFIILNHNLFYLHHLSSFI